MIILEASKISVDLNGRSILRDVSVRLKEGSVTAILGANGAGKTTLVRALNGTLPASKGEIFFQGRPINSMTRREVARRIAVVAQENETKFPVKVLEFILSGRFVHGGSFGWETDEDLRSANSALASCDLKEFAERTMNELSGGERQRVVLARAIAAETAVLLLDEPTANLDISHQALMFRLIRERCRDHGTAAAVITHDLNLASEFADRALLVKEGSVYGQGTPEDSFTAANIAAVFGMNVLLDKNPTSGRVRVTTIY